MELLVSYFACACKCIVQAFFNIAACLSLYLTNIQQKWKNEKIVYVDLFIAVSASDEVFQHNTINMIYIERAASIIFSMRIFRRNFQIFVSSALVSSQKSLVIFEWLVKNCKLKYYKLWMNVRWHASFKIELSIMWEADEFWFKDYVRYVTQVWCATT